MSALPSIIPSLEVPVFVPEHYVTIDFESFWEPGYTLKSMSTSDYVMDPRFEVHGASVKIDGGETRWFDEPELREWIETWPWEKTALLAHHAQFDGFICSMIYGIAPGLWFDTLSMSRAMALPGNLEDLAEIFGVGRKNTEQLVNSKGKHRKDFTDLEWAEFANYACNDTDLEWDIFQKMMEHFPEVELYVIDATIRMFTEPQLVLDEPQLREYLAEEGIRKAALLERVGLTKKDVGSNDKLADVFRQLGVEPPVKLSPKAKNPDGTKKEVYAFAKTDPGMQELLEHPDDEVRWLAEARISVKSTQTETRGQRFLRMGSNGRPLPVYLKYCGAHTTRWSAGDKTQFQNLQKTNKKDPKKGMLKKSLCAIPSRRVVAADSGAIEARGTAWLAGHQTLIDGFRLNKDVYSEFASQVFGRKIDRKANPEDEVPGFLGKVCILGLGYQMGWPKLSTTLLAGAMGGPPVRLTLKDADTMSVDLDKFMGDERKMKNVAKMVSRLAWDDLVVHCACSEKIVNTYRTANKPIKDLWKLMEHVLETMLEAGPTDQFSFGPNECLTIIKNGIILPNGLTLHYPELRKSKRILEDGTESWYESYSYRGKHHRVHTYGGSMTENVIQALSRIIISEQMLSLKAKYGYEPVLLTHDEIATITAAEEAALAEWRIVEEMKVAPKWAAGWPLNAEGGSGQSYGAA